MVCFYNVFVIRFFVCFFPINFSFCKQSLQTTYKHDLITMTIIHVKIVELNINDNDNHVTGTGNDKQNCNYPWCCRTYVICI